MVRSTPGLGVRRARRRQPAGRRRRAGPGRPVRVSHTQGASGPRGAPSIAATTSARRAWSVGSSTRTSNRRTDPPGVPTCTTGGKDRPARVPDVLDHGPAQQPPVLAVDRLAHLHPGSLPARRPARARPSTGCPSAAPGLGTRARDGNRRGGLRAQAGGRGRADRGDRRGQAPQLDPGGRQLASRRGRLRRREVGEGPTPSWTRCARSSRSRAWTTRSASSSAASSPPRT